MSAAAKLPLLQRCRQQAQDTYNARLAELKTIEPMLARLDEAVPVFERHGLVIDPERISYTRRQVGEQWVRVLRITTSWLYNSATSTRWLAAMLDAGFQVVKIEGADGRYPLAIVRRGHLRVCIDITPDDAAQLSARMPAAAEKEAA